MGVVEHIHITGAAGQPMVAVDRVRATAGVGLEGDRYAAGIGRWSNDPGSGRQVTLIEAESIDELRSTHGIDLPPGATRRNVTTRGVGLNELVGKQFRIGTVLCEGTRLCEPCEYMQGLVGQPVLAPLVHKAGLRAIILSGGDIAVGDEVSVHSV